jgi:hypothetical protein
MTQKKLLTAAFGYGRDGFLKGYASFKATLEELLSLF